MTAKRVAKAAAILALAMLPAAQAAAAPVEEGRVTLRLSSANLLMAKVFGGVKVRGLKPALGHDELINLPVGGGRLNGAGKGRLVLDGALRLTTHRRAATLTDLVLDTEERTLSAKQGGHRIALARVRRPKAARRGFGTEVALRLAITREAATLVNSKAGLPGLIRPGEALGSAQAIARFERVKVIDGRTYLDVGDPFLEKLRALKVNTKAIGNAWALGTYFAIPDTVGEAALDLSGGRVVSDDGIALKQFESDAELALHNVEYDFDRGVVSAGITTAFTLPSEAKVTPLVRFRLTVTHKNAHTGELSGGATGALTDAFADRLNEAFAAPKGIAPPFAGGEPVQISFSLQTRRPPR